MERRVVSVAVIITNINLGGSVGFGWSLGEAGGSGMLLDEMYARNSQGPQNAISYSFRDSTKGVVLQMVRRFTSEVQCHMMSGDLTRKEGMVCDSSACNILLFHGVNSVATFNKVLI
jgi:hypothetical protein